MKAEVVVPALWTKAEDLWKSGEESFDANGIEIPFPQRTVHLLTPADEEGADS